MISVWIDLIQPFDLNFHFSELLLVNNGVYFQWLFDWIRAKRFNGIICQKYFFKSDGLQFGIMPRYTRLWTDLGESARQFVNDLFYEMEWRNWFT